MRQRPYFASIAPCTGCETHYPGRMRTSLPAVHVILLLTVFSTSAWVGAEEKNSPHPHKLNQREQSKLPSSGDRGIARDYKFDREISAHAAVIFADQFEEKVKLGDRWDEVRNKDSAVLSLVENGADSGHCLKVMATLGQNTGGGMTKWFEAPDAVFIRFYTKFDSDCDYVHHFCTLRANAGLKGSDRWSGFGGAGVLPDPQRRFSTALEPWGNWGKLTPPGKWNFYSYWHEMEPSPDGKYWGNSFLPEDQPTIRRGEWICAEFMLKHNTPGKPDGEQAFWINGKLLGHWKGICWRTAQSLKANALTLECYITDRWTKQKTNIVYFDNIVIASEYIGPM
ncbi:MAG: hypothetical protein ACI9R3_005802 [Verrucomicrobiales bacterium]|jgi:hypothetical protein